MLGASLGGIGVSGNTFGSLTDPDEGNRARHRRWAGDRDAGPGAELRHQHSTFANNEAEEDGGAFSYALPPGGSENFSVDGNDCGRQQGRRLGRRRSHRRGQLLPLDKPEHLRGELARADHRRHIPPAITSAAGSTCRGRACRGFVTTYSEATPWNAFPNGQDYGGGGLSLRGADLNVQSEFSTGSRATRSRASRAPARGSRARAAASSSRARRATWYSFLDAVAGNSVGAFGEGGGMYSARPADDARRSARRPSRTTPSAPAGVRRPRRGRHGRRWSCATRSSSTARSPTSAASTHIDVTYSDACQGGAPFPGAGNICANPQLVGGD